MLLQCCLLLDIDPRTDSPKQTRTLVLIDNMMFYTTHSRFFKDLKSSNSKLTIEYVDQNLISQGQIKLIKDGAHIYDNLILMCTSLVEFPQTAEFDIKKFYDEGKNIFFVGDFDTSDFFRQTARDFGFSFDAAGSSLIDFKNALEKVTPNIFEFSNFRDIPFMAEGV